MFSVLDTTIYYEYHSLVMTWLIDQFHKSHDAPFPYSTMHLSEQKWAHFCSEWYIVGFGAWWDLWVVNFLQNTHNRHPIACLSVRARYGVCLVAYYKSVLLPVFFIVLVLGRSCHFGPCYNGPDCITDSGLQGWGFAGRGVRVFNSWCSNSAGKVFILNENNKILTISFQLNSMESYCW